MHKIPFSEYDFFGHLVSGAIILAGFGFAAQGTEVFHHELGINEAVALVLGAYLIGHVVASVSSFLLERRLTRWIIGSSTTCMFSNTPIGGWRRLLSAHLKPLPPATAERVLARAKKQAGVGEPSEALFFHCFGVVRQEASTRERLTTFLSLYGFCRNAAMAALINAAVMGFALGANSAAGVDTLSAGFLVSVVLAGVMYLRYLKFYRLYAVEVYVTYAEENR